MASIQDYVGQYTVRQGTHDIGLKPLDRSVRWEDGDTVYIGTGSHHAPPPRGRKVGVSLYNGEQQKLPPSGKAEFTFADGTLFYRKDGYHFQISLLQNPTNSYKAAYGVITYGDPDQVGVWGADNNPPT